MANEIYEWTNELRTGNMAIDTQHRLLFTIYGHLRSDLETTDPKAVFKELIHYTETHFRDEEKLMTTIRYPEILKHQQIHKELMVQVKDYADQYSSGKLSDILHLENLLRHWLVDHILGEDLKFAKYLENQKKKATEE